MRGGGSGESSCCKRRGTDNSVAGVGTFLIGQGGGEGSSVGFDGTTKASPTRRGRIFLGQRLAPIEMAAGVTARASPHGDGRYMSRSQKHLAGGSRCTNELVSVRKRLQKQVFAQNERIEYNNTWNRVIILPQFQSFAFENPCAPPVTATFRINPLQQRRLLTHDSVNCFHALFAPQEGGCAPCQQPDALRKLRSASAAGRTNPSST